MSMSRVEQASADARGGVSVKSPVSVPLLDLKAQFAAIETDVMSAIGRVIESQHFILGPEVTALENEVAAYVGAAAGVGVSSGTDALLIALMALDVGAGDEVITTPFSFFATAGVIARLGATPVFVDIDPATFNIDAAQVADRITERTRAIMPVHLFGRVADMNGLRTAIGDRAIPLVEDAAQAIGSRDDTGAAAGTLGDVGCFSFFPSKNLGCFGDGGMVTANDPSLVERLRILRVHGSKPKYFHREVGGNFRLDAIQAAILRAKLPHLDEWTMARRRNADRYRTLFAAAGLEGAITLPTDTQGHCYNQFVIRTRDRDELQRYLKSNGIGTEVYYPLPLHLQECFRGLGYGEGDLPHAEQAAREVLALPVYPELSAAQQEHVVNSIGEFLTAR